jgi:hypothetical protein
VSGPRSTGASCSGPTATYRARFSPRPHASVMGSVREPASPLPRVTHLLVLAHRISSMIRAGEIRDWAEAARLAGVTRARMSQIARLLALSPNIQQALLAMMLPGPPHQFTERSLRRVSRHAEWSQQTLLLKDAIGSSR